MCLVWSLILHQYLLNDCKISNKRHINLEINVMVVIFPHSILFVIFGIEFSSSFITNSNLILNSLIKGANHFLTCVFLCKKTLK